LLVRSFVQSVVLGVTSVSLANWSHEDGEDTPTSVRICVVLQVSLL
jgi:hypothetical protein